MAQIVVSGNIVQAYENSDRMRFVAHLRGIVKDTENDNEWKNATVVQCDALPDDISTQGYLYHAGKFIPCAPFGVGVGNFAVVCDDCKTIKDSGVSATSIGKVAVVEFVSGGSGGSITVDFVPRFAFIPISSLDSLDSGTSEFAIVTDCGGIYCQSAHSNTGGEGTSTITGMRSVVEENTISFEGADMVQGHTYTATVVGGV